MNWRHKALIQSTVAKLPPRLSYAVYYLLQRRFGGLRCLDPTSRLQAGISIVQEIGRQGQTAEAKTFLEIGTGERINLPVALWLCGASNVLSVDLHPYLKPELVLEDMAYLRSHGEEIQDLFEGQVSDDCFQERFARLIAEAVDLEGLAEVASIRYRAPADATCLDLPAQSVDCHVSCTVLEHIPPATLEEILLEGRRLLKKGGLLVHYIDPSDHFAHSDPSISAINFLQFSEDEWARYAGNRYTYHNRLRVDDYVALFEKVGLQILSLSSRIDSRSLDELTAGFVVDGRFEGKSPETNAAMDIWIVASADQFA